jgi:hypothetical protein
MEWLCGYGEAEESAECVVDLSEMFGWLVKMVIGWSRGRLCVDLDIKD